MKAVELGTAFKLYYFFNVLLESMQGQLLDPSNNIHNATHLHVPFLECMHTQTHTQTHRDTHTHTLTQTHTDTHTHTERAILTQQYIYYILTTLR